MGFRGSVSAGRTSQPSVLYEWCQGKLQHSEGGLLHGNSAVGVCGERFRHQLSAERKERVAWLFILFGAYKCSVAWIFRKEGRDEQRGLSQSERWCVYFFFVIWKWPHTSLWTLATSTISNTDPTGKSVTYWELFLLDFHLDGPQFLVNFTSNTSACLNPAKENKEKNCSLWAEEKRGKESVCHPSASATHKRGTRHDGGNRIKTKEL